MNQRGRSLFVVLTTVVAITAAVFFAHPAKADPHAMFYTAIGQQQLFFNALAALDQADYVEPAKGASPFSREKLLQNYTTAKQTGSSDAQLDKTKTDLSSVVTRGVTLQGNDLWESYKQFQLALEVARRNSANELARKLCQHSAGISGCDQKTVKNTKQQDNAIVRDPVDGEASNIVKGGLTGIFSSGSSSDQQARKDIWDNAIKKNTPATYYGFDPGIAILRQNAGSDDQKQGFINSILNSARTALGADTISPDALSNITINADGQPQLAYTLKDGSPPGVAYAATNELSPEAFTSQYLGDIFKIINLPLQAFNAGEVGMSQGAASASADLNGYKADRKNVNEGALSPGQYGEIKANVISPAQVKIAQVQAIQDLPVQLDAAQAYAPPNAETQPGNAQLVARSSNQPMVKGAITYNSPAVQNQVSQELLKIDAAQKQLSSGQVKQGEVKGMMDDIQRSIQFLSDLYSGYTEAKPGVSTDVNPIASQEEEGLRAALTALDPSFDQSQDIQDAVNAQKSGNSDFLDSIWQDLCDYSNLCH